MSDDWSFQGPHEPAFPSQTRNGHEVFNRPVFGLTKREYFASMAMQSMIMKGYPSESKDAMAGMAVEMADALMGKLR